MSAAHSANAYKNQQIMTAPPEMLTLMLYNGAIRFVAESMKAIDQGNVQQAHSTNLRAQDIVREFIATLDMNYEISQNWLKLYEYIEYCLIQGNVQKDKTLLEEAKNMLQEFRDAWEQAMKLERAQRSVAK